MDKKQAFITNIFYYGFILVFAYLGLKYLAPVMLPFIIAFIVVSALKIPADYAGRKIQRFNSLILPAFVTIFYGGLFLFLFKLSANIIPAISNFVLQLPNMYSETFLPALQGYYRKIDDIFVKANPEMVLEFETLIKQVIQQVGEFISESSGTVIKAIPGLAASVPSIVVKIVITVISSYFIAGDYERIVGYVFGKLSDPWKERVNRVITQTKHILKVFFSSYSLLMFITFVELTIGLSLIKIPYAVWIALAISIFDILPILGTGGILIPWAVIAAVLGEFKMAAGIAILYIVITAIRNTIEPKLVGKQIGLHPLATLISMTVGAKLFGLVGLFGFPLILSLGVKMKEMEKKDNVEKSP